MDGAIIFFAMGVLSLLYLPGMIVERAAVSEIIYFGFLGIGGLWVGLKLANEYILDKFTESLE